MDKALQTYVSDYIEKTKDSRTDNIASMQKKEGASLKGVLLDPKKDAPAMLNNANRATGIAMIMREIEMDFHERKNCNANAIMDLVTNQLDMIAARFPYSFDEQQKDGRAVVEVVEGALQTTIKIQGVSSEKGRIEFERPLELRLSPSEQYNEEHNLSEGFRTESQWVLYTKEVDPYDPSNTTNKAIAKGELTEQGLTNLLDALGKERFVDDKIAEPDFSKSLKGQLHKNMFSEAIKGMVQAEKDLGIERGLGELRERAEQKSQAKSVETQEVAASEKPKFDLYKADATLDYLKSFQNNFGNAGNMNFSGNTSPTKGASLTK